MASILTHAFAAIAVGKTCYPQRQDWRFWLLATASAIVPDADVIGFYFGIQYGDMFGHRGFSHSLLFALLWSLLVVRVGFKSAARRSKQWWSLLAFFFLVAASHGVLDAMTNGGLGVAFFTPFDARRYFFPWRPITVSPIGLGNFISHWGALVLLSEIKYVWLPLLFVWLSVWSFRRLAGRETRLKTDS
jgi:inner membrane protein